MKEKIIKLYLLQVKYKGIPSNIYNSLSKDGRKMLEKKRKRYYLKEKFRKKIKVVLTGGAFDVLHPGHIYLLNKAKKFGDVLIVVVARDETVEKRKGKKPLHPLKFRVFQVNALKPVDLAIPGAKRFLDTIKRVSPDIVVFGPDQEVFPVPGAKIKSIKKALSDKHFHSSIIAKKVGI